MNLPSAAKGEIKHYSSLKSIEEAVEWISNGEKRILMYTAGGKNPREVVNILFSKDFTEKDIFYQFDSVFQTPKSNGWELKPIPLKLKETKLGYVWSIKEQQGYISETMREIVSSFGGELNSISMDTWR